MLSHSTSLSDVQFFAAIWRQLSTEDRTLIREQQRELDLSVVALFEMMIGPGGWGTFLAGDRPIDHAWRHAAQHRDAIPKEREDDAFEAEVDRIEAVEAPVTPAVELPVLRPHRGPSGHEDRPNLLRMYGLLHPRTVASEWAAAKRVLGTDNSSRIEGLKKKYLEWREDGFPTELVPVADLPVTD